LPVVLQLSRLAQQLKLNLRNASTASKMLFATQRLQLKKESSPVVALLFYRHPKRHSPS
jgi:hypothetical protein